MTTVEILRKTRALVEAGWGQGMYLGDDCTCIAIAFAEVPGSDDGPEWRRARNAFRQAAGMKLEDESAPYWNESNMEMFQWNDAPSRTQAEVLSTLDRAIALAETQAATRGEG